MFYIVSVQGYMVGDAIASNGIPENSVVGIMIVTAITAGLTSIFLESYAKHPVALASGMGINAYIAYTLISTPDGMTSSYVSSINVGINIYNLYLLLRKEQKLSQQFLMI